MTESFLGSLADLAGALNDLRWRFRQAARAEVARAVGDTLHAFALELIAGQAATVVPHRQASSPWDDPWDEPDPGSWPGAALPEDGAPRNPVLAKVATLPAAVIIGLGAARWSLARTGQLPLAIAVGVGAGVAAALGGPAAEALLGAWSAADQLLHFAESDRHQRRASHAG